MIVESILRRLELFQRLILLFLLGFVPLVIDPNVMASFVDTKFIIVELLVLFLIIIEAVRLVFRPGRKTFSLISVSLIGLVIVHFLHALPAWLPGDTFLENLADAYPEYALVTALKYSLFLVLPLFFVSAFNTRKRLAMAENFLIIMSVPIFIYGLAQYMGYELFEYQLQMDKSNVHGMLGNAHYLGGYLAMLLFIVLHRVVATRNANLRPLLIFLTVVIVFLVYASKSRGAMLCVGASAFLFLGIRAFVGWRRKQHWFWRVVLAAAHCLSPTLSEKRNFRSTGIEALTTGWCCPWWPFGCGARTRSGAPGSDSTPCSFSQHFMRWPGSRISSFSGICPG